MRAPLEMVHSLLNEALGLKAVARAGWLRVGVGAPESVAAHGWGVAWLVLALCPAGVDRGRALAIAVLHDLAEVRVGDLTPHDPVSREEKRAREAAAMAELLRPLPNAAELLALWEEYESGSTAEGRLVKACDRLDMALQARRYAADLGTDPRDFLASALAGLDPGLLRDLAAFEG